MAAARQEQGESKGHKTKLDPLKTYIALYRALFGDPILAGK